MSQNTEVLRKGILILSKSKFECSSGFTILVFCGTPENFPFLFFFFCNALSNLRTMGSHSPNAQARMHNLVSQPIPPPCPVICLTLLQLSLTDQAFSNPPQKPPSLGPRLNISWHPLSVPTSTFNPANNNCAGRPHIVLMLINNLGADGPGAKRPAQRRPLCVRTTIPSSSEFRSSLAPRIHTFLESWLSIYSASLSYHMY
jgi:hypothetical protein